MVVAPTIYLTSARAANSPLLAKLSERLQSSGSTVVNANAVRKDAVEDDRPAYLRRQAWMDDSQLVVADAGSGDASVGAEVYYALHKARVPALCLVPRGEPVPGMLAAGAHPLLTTVEYADDAAAEEAVEAFVRPSAEPGRVFVIEGGDGAGKQTQTRMLMERLRATGHPVRTMDFPHDSAMHGKLIRELLTGAKGDIKAVNPLLFASLYAQNRWDVAPILHEWVRRGYNVVLDRYVEANFGHQASKPPPARCMCITPPTCMDPFPLGEQAARRRAARAHRRAVQVRARLAGLAPGPQSRLPRPAAARRAPCALRLARSHVAQTPSPCSSRDGLLVT